jgi:hypothetical protein
MAMLIKPGAPTLRMSANSSRSGVTRRTSNFITSNNWRALSGHLLAFEPSRANEQLTPSNPGYTVGSLSGLLDRVSKSRARAPGWLS